MSNKLPEDSDGLIPEDLTPSDSSSFEEMYTLRLDRLKRSIRPFQAYQWLQDDLTLTVPMINSIPQLPNKDDETIVRGVKMVVFGPVIRPNDYVECEVDVNGKDLGHWGVFAMRTPDGLGWRYKDETKCTKLRELRWTAEKRYRIYRLEETNEFGEVSP